MQPTVINSLATVINIFATLGIVIAVILLFAWIFKRVGLNQQSSNGLIKIISGLMISPKEKIILIEVADQWVLVGISSGVMETLHAFPKTTDPEILEKLELDELNQSLKNSTQNPIQQLIIRWIQQRKNNSQSQNTSTTHFSDNLHQAEQKHQEQNKS